MEVSERKEWFLVAILSCIVFLGMCGFILHPLDLITCKARGGTLVEDQNCQSGGMSTFCLKAKVGLLEYVKEVGGFWIVRGESPPQSKKLVQERFNR